MRNPKAYNEELKLPEINKPESQNGDDAANQYYMENEQMNLKGLFKSDTYKN